MYTIQVRDLLFKFSVTINNYFIIDNYPLPVYKFGRVYYCCSFCS